MTNQNVNINWFPGHMTKAQREIEQILPQVDVIIELRDARAVLASANPLLQRLASQKPRVIILSKTDLADSKCVKKWSNELNSAESLVLALNLTSGDYRLAIIEAVLKVMAKKHARLAQKGINPRATRALVVGIPNVGKSTFINTMRQKKIMPTANTPGVTRYLRLIKVDPTLELIDSPGLLWPKFYDLKQAYHLALIGSMNDHILPLTEILTYALAYLKHNYPQVLTEHFFACDDYSQLIEIVGKQAGYYLAQQQIDEKRCQIHLLKLLRSNQVQVCWDQPDGK